MYNYKTEVERKIYIKSWESPSILTHTIQFLILCYWNLGEGYQCMELVMTNVLIKKLGISQDIFIAILTFMHTETEDDVLVRRNDAISRYCYFSENFFLLNYWSVSLSW